MVVKTNDPEVKELQNNQVLTYEMCFRFHRVANAAESTLYEMFKATDKWSKLLCINCNTIDWNSLWNNSRFIDKILYLNKSTLEMFILYTSYYATIGTMLLLESSGVPYSNFQLLEFSPQI